MRELSSEQRIERNALWCTALFMLISWRWKGELGLFSSFLGSILVLISFRLWRLLIPFFTGTRKQPNKFVLFFIVLAKLGVIGLFIWLVSTKNSTEPLAFFLGLSCIVAAICWEAVRDYFGKAS